MLRWRRGVRVPTSGACALLSGDQRLVCGRLRRAHRCPDRRLGRDRLGRHALVSAPTGSGKTLAAFLWALDRLAVTPGRAPGVRVLYVSPLKALAVDVEQNLRAPLAGVRGAAQRLGAAPPSITTALRTGDTPAEERRRLAKHPPDVLVTTPASIFLLLTSAARDALRTVETVIVNEVHALAGTKRGAHLALTLERLDCLLPAPAQRMGLSATVRPRQRSVDNWTTGAPPRPEACGRW